MKILLFLLFCCTFEGFQAEKCAEKCVEPMRICLQTQKCLGLSLKFDKFFPNMPESKYCI